MTKTMPENITPSLGVQSAEPVPPKSEHSKISYHIAIPPAELTHDSALVRYLTQLVNTVYTEAETGIFDAAYLRTNEAEIAAYLAAGSLALASTSGPEDSPWSPPEKVLGCVRILKVSATTGEVAMLVAAPRARGSGLGGQLVAFAETYARTTWGVKKMMMELLVPSTFEHKLKTWVSAWYQRLGYVIVGTSDFRLSYPRIADCVITPTDYRRFEKVL